MGKWPDQVRATNRQKLFIDTCSATQCNHRKSNMATKNPTFTYYIYINIYIYDVLLWFPLSYDKTPPVQEISQPCLVIRLPGSSPFEQRDEAAAGASVGRDVAKMRRAWEYEENEGERMGIQWGFCLIYHI